MGSKSRTIILIGGVLGLVLLCSWLLSNSRSAFAPDDRIPGSSHSTTEAGLGAMHDWFQALGYQTEMFQYEEWLLPDEFDVLIIAAPTESIRNDELDELLRWVATGKTLIVADYAPNAIYDHYDIDLVELNSPPGAIPAQQPFDNLAVEQIDIDTFIDWTSSQANIDVALDLRKSRAISLYGIDDESFVAAITEGAGVVYFVSSLEIFSNRGLAEENNARMVLNLIDRHPAGSTIVFDEIHHGYQLQPAPVAGPANRQFFAPLIAALMYTALVVALWGFLSGRRFGSPIAMFSNKQNRSSAEYIQSMAGLFQRSRQTDYVLKHYKHAFKRHLAKPYGVNPRLEDPVYIEELNRFVSLDVQRLQTLLNALSASHPDEQSLRRIVYASDRFIQDVEDRR